MKELLRSGADVDIDRARPDDLDTVSRFYALLCDDATYLRFFGIRRSLPVAELGRVVGGTDDHVTLLARQAGTMIGIGEYIVGNDPTEAEVAFAVADDHHREGVATLLLEHLALVAHDRGLLRLTAMTLPSNADMQLVFRTVGLPVRTTFDDGILYTALDVTTLAAMHAARQKRRAQLVPAGGRPLDS
ncbi:MAG: family N-acetyltransferase [Ilumatobacteraceae bacterium]|nr:family N-acetyltransferase [Ilumatobacteraceae bacterium]MCU1387297.1 family N-acetyltransferase [Ilumatobacteraceae bacterium]